MRAGPRRDSAPAGPASGPDRRQYDPRRIIRDALLEPPEPRHRDDPEDDEAEAVPVRVERADGVRARTVWDDEAT